MAEATAAPEPVLLNIYNNHQYVAVSSCPAHIHHFGIWDWWMTPSYMPNTLAIYTIESNGYGWTTSRSVVDETVLRNPQMDQKLIFFSLEKGDTPPRHQHDA